MPCVQNPTGVNYRGICTECLSPFLAPGRGRKICPACHRCRRCGLSLQGKQTKQRYCSRECAWTIQRTEAVYNRTCERCQRSFKSRQSQQRLCRECHRCLHCDEYINGPSKYRFCSQRCAGRWRWEHDATRLQESLKKAQQASRQPDVRQRAGMSMRGQKRPTCSGPLHPKWRGGIKQKRAQLRNLAVVRDWRRSVFERDDYTCHDCGHRHPKQMQAHHIKPWALFPELRLDVSNGQTLCRPCHLIRTKQEDLEIKSALMDKGRPINQWK